LGIAVEHAVLDIETNEELLKNCLALIDSAHRGLVDCKMGKFGSWPVTMIAHADESVTVFADGPLFEASRNQSAGLYLSKDDAKRAINAALSGK
jgi:hypothetical protein